MKRIITVIPNYLGGGAETVTDAIVKALSPEGFEFILITEQVIEPCKERVESLYSRTIIADFQLARYGKETSRRLAELIKPLHGDILWLIGDEFDSIPLLRQVLNPGGKVIYHLHSVPFFQVKLKTTYYGQDKDCFAYRKWYVCKHLREKLFHSYTRRYTERTRATAANVDAFVTLCNGYTRQLTEIYPQYADKFITIYNPAGEPVKVDPADKRWELLYLGRLSYADKRPDRLIPLFGSISSVYYQWTMNIVGDGPERGYLEKEIDDYGIRNMKLCGFTPNPEEYLKTASILCMTSEFEGWPMALIEAMQYGVVPIAYGCSEGVREILADGRGIILEPDEEFIHTRQLIVLMNNPDLRKKITDTHAAFLKKLSIKNIAGQWKRLFLS